MNKTRIIARMDIKNEFVIKGIHLEGLRKVGNPNQLAQKYYEEGIDEIILMDAVAAYYDRNSLHEIIETACQNIFIPITVGGGIRNIRDIQSALNSGADKVAINTQAVKTPNFIREAAKMFGSQAIIISIDAKSIGSNKWEAYIDNGREPTGIDAIQWAMTAEQLGAGEVMVTSIDNEGTKKGFDISLINALNNSISIPVIASGGAGKTDHISNLIETTSVGGVAVASLLHYNIDNVSNIKNTIHNQGHEVRL